MVALWVLVILISIGVIIWGSETFVEHLGTAAAQLNVSVFALGVLLAGAEPEELVTAIAAAVGDAPSIVFGQVVGTNVAICLVALGLGALKTRLPFGRRMMGYALFCLPLASIAASMVWKDQNVSRLEGALLVGLYVLYVIVIWTLEKRPSAFSDLEELQAPHKTIPSRSDPLVRDRISRELLLVLVGLAAIVGGAALLVKAVREMAVTETIQADIGLTLIGFATAFETIALAWSAAKRKLPEVVVASVLGSITYNVTLTLGAAALIHPLQVVDARYLHWPFLAMLIALATVMLMAAPKGYLGRTAGRVLLATYPIFVVAVFVF